MRFAVCLSRIPDPETVGVDPVTGEIDLSRTLSILNPADAAALEVALSLRSSSDTVTALTVGPEDAESILRDALAVGADEVLRLWEEERPATLPAITGLMIATALRTEGLPDAVLCGSRSLGGESGNVPALIAEYLDWPVVTDIIDFNIHAARVRFQRRLPRGARSVGEVMLPAVLAVEASMATVRYAGLPGLMAAKRATVPVRYLPDLGLSPTDLTFPMPTVRVATPPYPRPREIFIPDSALAPDDRVAQILSAGVAKKAGTIVEGAPEEMAETIIAFLSERGFLDRPA